MKLVISIISNKDIERVLSAISSKGFYATKISTVGQFLTGGHTVIFCGTDDEKVPVLFDIIKNNVTKRIIKTHGVTSTLTGSLLKAPVDVEEGGAIAFTLNVEDYQKF